MKLILMNLILMAGYFTFVSGAVLGPKSNEGTKTASALTTQNPETTDDKMDYDVKNEFQKKMYAKMSRIQRFVAKSTNISNINFDDVNLSKKRIPKKSKLLQQLDKMLKQSRAENRRKKQSYN